jgi:hypothetical protein
MKKIITIITSCILLAACNNQPATEAEEPEETRQEILNLDLVSSYEFFFYSFEEDIDIYIEYIIQEPEDVQKINEFLGEYKIYYPDGVCDCMEQGVRIFFTTGEGAVFEIGGGGTSDKIYFINPDEIKPSFIFENKNYSEFIDLIKSLKQETYAEILRNYTDKPISPLFD